MQIWQPRAILAPKPGNLRVINSRSPLLRPAVGGMKVIGMETSDALTESTIFRGVSSGSQFLRQVFTKVVIQEIPSRLYLSAGDFWTPDFRNATTFDSRSLAQEKATTLKLQNVQLVLNCETKEWGIIPIET